MTLSNRDKRALSQLSQKELDAVTAHATRLAEQVQTGLALARASGHKCLTLPLTKLEFNQIKPRRVIFSNRPLRIVLLMALEEIGIPPQKVRVRMYTRLLDDDTVNPTPRFDRAELVVSLQ